MGIPDTRAFRVALIAGVGVLLLILMQLASGGRSDPRGPAAPVDSGGQVELKSGTMRACLDGSHVSSGARCGGLLTNEVMFAVAGVSGDQCRADTDYPWNAPGQSFACTLKSGELHVARYRDAAAKAARIELYGQCSRYAGGWEICGVNPTNHRWVRAYVADDLLMYTSSPDKAALLSLRRIPAETVLHGR